MNDMARKANLRMQVMRYLYTLALVLILTSTGLAGTVFLKGGLVFKGSVVEKTKEEIKLETFNGEVKIPVPLIRKIDRKKSPYELYQAELKKLKDKNKETDAEAQYKLGLWCKKKKIWHKAKFHLKKVLVFDSEHKKAEKALKQVEKAWSSEHKKSLIRLTLNVGVVTDMSKEEMEKLAEMIKKVSHRLARITGGIMFISEVVFTDNCRTGNMLYNPNQSRKEVPGSRNNFSHGPANWFVGCILHEFGHFNLGLADEYDTSIYGVTPRSRVFCENCVMALKHDRGWCNSLNHPKGCLGNAPGCQECLVARYGKRSPLLAEAFNFSEEEILYPPETKITINNTAPKANQ